MDRPTVFIDPTGRDFGLPSPGEIVGDVWDATKDVSSAVWGTTTTAADWAWQHGRCIVANAYNSARNYLVEHAQQVAQVLLTALAAAGCYHYAELAARAGAAGPEVAAAFALGAAVTCGYEAAHAIGGK